MPTLRITCSSMAESSVAKDTSKLVRVLKCTLLTPSKDPPENLKGLGEALECCIGKPLAGFSDWSNRYWLKYAWRAKPPAVAATPIPVRQGRGTSFDIFSKSVERTEDRICLFIGPHPQLPIHDSLLINSSGLFIVCCCEDYDKEAREKYLVRILDTILAASTVDKKSVVFLHGVDCDSWKSKYRDSNRKLVIVPIECKDLLRQFEKKASGVMQDLVLQKVDIDFLTESDSVVLCRAANEAKLTDKTLEQFHDLGIIFRQQLKTESDAMGLTFVKPNVLHKLLHEAGKLDQSLVESVVSNLYSAFDDELEECKDMSEIDKYDLDVNKDVILTELLRDLKLVVEIEEGTPILLSSIPDRKPENTLAEVSVKPLWIKLDSEMSEYDFQLLATDVYKKILDENSTSIQRTQSFVFIVGLGYKVSICRHNDRLIVVNFLCDFIDFEEKALTQPKRFSLLRKCKDVLLITKNALTLAERKYDLGFQCPAKDKEKHKCGGLFVSYKKSTRSFSCEGSTIFMSMSHCIWFQDQLGLLEDHYKIDFERPSGLLNLKVKDEECACRNFVSGGSSSSHEDEMNAPGPSDSKRSQPPNGQQPPSKRPNSDQDLVNGGSRSSHEARKRSPADIPSSDSKRQPSDSGPIKSICDLLPFLESMLPHLGRLGPALGIPDYATAIIGGPKSNPDKCQDILQYWLYCTPAATLDLLCEKLSKVQCFARVVAKIQEAQQ